MTEDREEAPRKGGLKDLASSALLVGAVVSILVAGFALKGNKPDSPHGGEVLSSPPPHAIVLGSAVRQETPPPGAGVATPAAIPDPPAEPETAPPTAEAAVPGPPASIPSTPPKPAAAPARPSGPPAATFDTAAAPLARRAATDAARIAKSPGGWTAQLMVACRVETASRVVDASHGASKLYVLPAEVHGDACFRICWGTYKSAKEAAAATDLPPSLRGKDRVGAVEIAKVLP